jgi:quinol monooxygenase YgiN
VGDPGADGDGTVGVVARFAIKVEEVEAFIALAQREMVAPTQKEPGCIRYELWQDRQEPTRFAMVEEWESEEALATHLSQPGLQAALRQLLPMGAEPVQMSRYRPLR